MQIDQPLIGAIENARRRTELGQLNVVRGCYARGGGDSGREVRATAVGANGATTSPGSKELTTVVARGTMPAPADSATSIASAGAHALRILHSFLPAAVL